MKIMSNILTVPLRGPSELIQVSSHHINILDNDEIFVFGSNEAGIHGAGAARQAKSFGAKQGIGFGLQGHTYGIPTKDRRIETLSLRRIGNYADLFYDYAYAHPEKKFLVTAIGCGLAGYIAEDIAPLFKPALTIPNIYLPLQFMEILCKSMTPSR